MEKSILCLVLALMLCFPNASTATLDLSLELDAMYSPPATIPTDAQDMVYSSPANDHMLEPVKVRILDVNGDLDTNNNMTVTATTINESNLDAPNTGDTYDGMLCMHRAYFSRFNWCRYLVDGNCEPELICDTATNPLGIVEVQAENGVAEFPRLLHTKPAVGSNRRLRFSISEDGDTVSVDSNPFAVHLSAAGLEFVSPADGDPGTVTVNHPMTFTVKTVAEDPDNPGSSVDLTTGRHSILNIDLTISWDSKKFYFYFPANFNVNQLLYTSYMLGGTDASENGRFDMVIRKKASAGVATYSDVRITTEATGVRLNFTQTQSNFPWERRPPVYDSVQSVLEDGVFKLWTVYNETTSDAVIFTEPFDVVSVAVDSLVITLDSLANFHPSMDANFPFSTPLVVQVVDSAGYIITDGPDSNLMVTVEANPAGVCLSTDSSFELSKGVGTFMGSICEPNQEDVKIRFSVTSAVNAATVTSDWSPQFDVTGNFLIGGFFSVYADLLVAIMAQAGVELVNSGKIWEPDFANSGRTLDLQVYYLQSTDIQETLDSYDQVRAQNMDPTQPTIRALLGSASDEDTIALSRVSQADQMPIMGYKVETADLSSKATHPYFGRVSFSANARFEAEAAFLSSHYWDKVIAIKDSANPLPTVMYQGFEKFDVDIVLEVTIPSLVDEPTDMSALPQLSNSVAQSIFDSGSKIIYSNVVPPTDIYLMREAMRLGFAPINGYVWILNTLSQSGFPQANERGECATTVPTCTTSFNSTIIIISGVDADIDGTVWKDYLNDAYQQVDPTTLGGATIFRWSSILGQQSQAHDAVVALVKGAMVLINRNETILAGTLMEAIRTINFTGGSGLLLFDENGDRIGFSASVYNMFPIIDLPESPNDIWYLASSWYVDPVTENVVETQYSTRIDRHGDYVPTDWAYPPHSFTNTRRVMGYNADLGSDLVELVSSVPAAYDCGADGCGGGLATTNPDTILYWNHGTCASQDTCECLTKNGTDDPGYAGGSCQQILCNPPCRNGECISPDICLCENLWSGEDCGTPLCTNSGCDLEHGNCTGPDVCTCIPGFYSSDCSKQCTCKNGECNDGQSGSGTCSSCDGGYAGSNCDVSIPLVVVPTLVVVGAALAAIIIFTVWYMKRMKFRAALANNDWMVDYNDVVILSDDKGAANSMAFRSMVSMAGDQQKHKDVVRNQGKWNNHEVAIKMVDKDSIAVSLQLRMEIKAVRDIRHKNLAAFIGACVDPPNMCVLMELGPKGSLDDLLSSESINVDWNFKYALLKDICRGMNYLSNTPIRSHGRLKASNCVVDNRWTLKITDYGMQLFKVEQRGVPKFNPVLGPIQRSADEANEGIENSIKAALLYTAPEILRSGVSHPDHVGTGTIQGDMYSMAMIMLEVLSHEAPFHEHLDYVDIDDLLQAISGAMDISSQLPQALGGRSKAAIRPSIPDKSDPAYVGLVEAAWSEDPMQRPTFSHLLKQLDQISPQRGDLMDNLVNMLEKYSTNLEAIVAERTSELAAEKARTEELVCRMLPKAIAEQLTRGETIAAETFECVTIYFSDIVGFTSIAGASNPLQVVDLLNDLYTCFDAIIDHFDVYKVETIGDAYMVVSGLPIRNGDQHAGEIASMSLHLLSAILSFTIRHMPETKLQLRIGIHSGPAVAGVVGLKMPRYCLFGDTVNTASRMESGGLALRVHMSDSTANILMKLGGYNIESRGEREVKGKGIMTTYWLKGQEGFNRPLPTEDMAVSASKHEFK